MEHVTPGGRETVEVNDGVHLTQLAVGEEMSVQHLRIEPGGEVPEHSHHHEQLGFVYRGVQTFLLEDGVTVDVGAGESYALESEEVHGAVNRGDTEMLAIDVFSPPRPSPDWLDD